MLKRASLLSCTAGRSMSERRGDAGARDAGRARDTDGGWGDGNA